MELHGKTVLLTGATGGLGRAIAKALAARGAHLVLSSRKSDELEALAGSLPGAGHRIVVSDLARARAAALALLEAAGEIDVLVANAALPASGKLDTTRQERDRARAAGQPRGADPDGARAAPAWSGRGSRPHGLRLLALRARPPTARASLYCATKFGLRGFALALREDLRGSGDRRLGGDAGDRSATPGMFADAGAAAPR